MTAVADSQRQSDLPVAERLVTALAARGVAADVSSRRRAEYSTDASNYRVVPTAVAFPRSVEEVLAGYAACRELGVPLTMRGAGTSIAGNAIGGGLVIDTSRYLNRIVSIDPAARTAVVEPGVILTDLQRAAAPYRLRFGPDPSTSNRCTIGGMIGNNACGSHALAYGRTADNVVGLDVLTGGGDRLDARAGVALPPTVQGVVDANRATIRTELGRFGRQVSGYSLEHLLPERGADLARAMVGTEGTCGIVLGATVRLVEISPATALVVLGYADMAAAADATPGLLPHSPLALEGLDRRLVDVVRARRGQSAVPDLPRGGGWLFVEMGGATEAEALDAAARLVADAGALDAAVIPDAGISRALWRIREDGAGLGGRTPDNQPAWPGWEDAAVPPAALGAYLREFDTLMGSYGLDGLAYGHFGDGCVHVRIDFPLAHRPARFRDFVFDAARLVASHGGSLSGEHGDGRARGELLPLMYSPAAIGAFAGFKAALDPENLLNPGVLVEPRPVDADLRLPTARSLTRKLAFRYQHDGGDFSTAVHRCVGVGKCRADLTPTGGFMCPSYHATGNEKDNTRGRARVLQEMANGSVVRDGWRSEEVLDVLDLCLSCKACASDCPAGVDMATYKAELLHQRYRRRLRPAAHYTLGWLPRWARLASVAPRLANTALHFGPASALAKRVGGIDARRPLPAFATTTFRSWFDARPAGADGDPILLWIDTFTDHFTPQVGQAAVEVLESAGFRVSVPPPLCCGLTWITTGQLGAARRRLGRTVDALTPYARAGTPIVGLEPSCTATLRSDAVDLLGDRAAPVAEGVSTLAELLATRPDWSPPRLDGVSIVAQPHCHQHAVVGFEADTALLARTGASVSTVGGCCGLAGNFGVERGHYDVSVKIAEHALLPAVRGLPDGPAGIVLADGFSCRTQLDQLSDRRGRHLAELLARKP